MLKLDLRDYGKLPPNQRTYQWLHQMVIDYLETKQRHLNRQQYELGLDALMKPLERQNRPAAAAKEPKGQRGAETKGCRYFATNTCNKGDACPYAHGVVAAPAPEKGGGRGKGKSEKRGCSQSGCRGGARAGKGEAGQASDLHRGVGVESAMPSKLILVH